VGFLRFSQMTRWICAILFSGFRKKHLFITSCIEKQCTPSLSFMLHTLAEKVQIMNRGSDTPDLNHRQPVVKESSCFK